MIKLCSRNGGKNKMFFNSKNKQRQEEAEAKLQEAKKELQSVEDKIKEKQKNLAEIQRDVEDKGRKLSQLMADLNECEGIIEMEDLGIPYVPTYLASSEAGKEINNTQKQIAKLISEDKIMIIKKRYVFSGSEAKGKQFQKNYCDNLLIGFNSYFEKKKKSVTEKSYEKIVELIKKSFEKYNKRGAIVGITINPEYLSLCLNLLKTELDKKIAVVAEKAAIKEEQRRIREEQRLIEDAEREKKKMEEMRKAMDISFSEALTEEERDKIKQEIAKIDKRIDDLNYRINNPKAGWLYVTESASMPGIKKIGVSRRENVYLRLAELSSSSVYYPFKMNAYCFSDDVFELERQMHKYFDEFRVAPNREFFKITTADAVKALTEVFHQEIHFPKIQQEEDDTNASED